MKNKPDNSWYTQGGIEPWEVISRANLDFWEGSVIKYTLRWRRKNGVEDLRKGIVYLEELIRQVEAGELVVDKPTTPSPLSNRSLASITSEEWEKGVVCGNGAVLFQRMVSIPNTSGFLCAICLGAPGGPWEWVYYTHDAAPLCDTCAANHLSK